MVLALQSETTKPTHHDVHATYLLSLKVHTYQEREQDTWNQPCMHAAAVEILPVCTYVDVTIQISKRLAKPSLIGIDVSAFCLHAALDSDVVELSTNGISILQSWPDVLVRCFCYMFFFMRHDLEAETGK